ncbi:hypothetical protein C922_04232 [Plasmodium inui San Antonio 1]|uniref:Uncharacterized protein n=1 Tax=Plasmodium inui San Antonio 1 TaxID=1237626 RepID=W7A827_9APIC|nr:hypothetical protein C922_04232 [Plasmodium inui San Antonio 1]EUD65289.1 hypothetical protein C922_04232 [Plasmodium inui San Antonio 1]
MIPPLLHISHSTVHSKGRYYPKNSIVNITVLHGQAYFLKSSTKDIVLLINEHNFRSDGIRRTIALLEDQYRRQKSTLKIIILPD